MATIYTNLVGCELLDSHFGNRHMARLRVKVATDYSASADVLQLGGGGKLFGVSTSLDLEDQIEAIRRDGKTVNLIDAAGGGLGGTVTPALYVDTVAISGNNVTAEVAGSTSTETDLTAAANVIPMEVWVVYDLS